VPYLLSCSLHLGYSARPVTPVAIKACHYLDSLEPGESAECLRALSKKTLRGKEHIIGERLTIADEERWQKFREAVSIKPINLEYIEQLYIEALAKRKDFDFRQLRGEIKAVCEPFLGKPVSNRGKVFHYETHIQNFRISTEFDLGGLPRLRYFQLVGYKDPDSGERSRVIMTDFFRWIGIGETAWEFMNNEDIPSAANVVGELCQSFMQGIQPIIHDAIE
jgi:hypothetical protein